METLAYLLAALIGSASIFSGVRILIEADRVKGVTIGPRVLAWIMIYLGSAIYWAFIDMLGASIAWM